MKQTNCKKTTLRPCRKLECGLDIRIRRGNNNGTNSYFLKKSLSEIHTEIYTGKIDMISGICLKNIQYLEFALKYSIKIKFEENIWNKNGRMVTVEVEWYVSRHLLYYCEHLCEFNIFHKKKLKKSVLDSLAKIVTCEIQLKPFNRDYRHISVLIFTTYNKILDDFLLR